MISQSSLLIGLLCLGGALGLLYFGGLWLTLRNLPKARKPLTLFGWSYILRLGAVLGVFHLILQRTHTEQIFPVLLICFLGFLLSRTFLISQIRPKDQPL